MAGRERERERESTYIIHIYIPLVTLSEVEKVVESDVASPW